MPTVWRAHRSTDGTLYPWRFQARASDQCCHDLARFLRLQSPGDLFAVRMDDCPPPVHPAMIP